MPLGYFYTSAKFQSPSVYQKFLHVSCPPATTRSFRWILWHCFTVWRRDLLV